MASVTRENIGLLNDKLTVNVSKEDYLPNFEKKLKEYGKTANIPGFRKGMVPAGMIKKMYGQSIFSDEVLRTVETELLKYLDKERPEIFAQPLPLDNFLAALDVTKPQDYSFGFEIGLKPAFTLADVSKAALTKHNVVATDEMVSDEINRMQIKGGKMTEPELIDNEDNVINFTLTELNAEGSEAEGGVKKENSVLLKYFTPALQKQLMGKKKEDSISFKLNEAFEGDKLNMMMQDLGFEKDNAEAASKSFKLSIDKVGLVEKRELEEGFFNEIYPGQDIKTEEELRAKLKEEIQQYWNAQSRNQIHDQLYHQLLDNTQIDFPDTFLKRWIQTGGEKPKTAEEAEAEYPTFKNQLKWTLISDKIITDNKLEVSPDEIKDSMRTEVMRYFGQMGAGGDMDWLDGYIDRMMKDEKHVDSTYRRLVTEKLFGHLETQIKPAEKTVTPEELTAMQHHHHH